MGTTVVTQAIAEISPRFKARIAGLCEFLEGLTSAWGQVLVLGGLVVAGDGAATARNIMAHELRFQLGFAASLIAVLFHIAWAYLFYDLFKAVNRRLSAFATCIILVGCAIQAVTCLLYLAPMLFLRGGDSMSAFTTPQLQQLALRFVALNGQAFDLYLVFFGFWCILIGYLIFQSGFMPRILGVLLAISGLGWAMFLAPPLAHHMFRYIAAASALGEIPLQFWLLVFGVNNERWHEQARLSMAH
jgi:Domain of unknown function (DUF4386)